MVISGNGTPGQTILPNTLIEFSCNEGYYLKPNIPHFLCDVDWNPLEMSKCEGKKMYYKLITSKFSILVNEISKIVLTTSETFEFCCFVIVFA